jgi:hypothetical protein
MNTTDRVTKAVEVHSFDRIRLQVNNVENEVEIKQGQRESLTIEARPDLLSRIRTEVLNGQLSIQMGGSWSDKISAALATSLGRPLIRYVVTVRNLTALDVFGLVHARVDNVGTERLRIKFGGVGVLQIAGLDAERLDVTVAHPSPCKVEVSGRAGEQHVSLNGMSEYDAHGLKSDKTTVVLRGPWGHAVVRADDELAITIGGPGSVEYYGHPRVTKKVSPMGVVTHRSAARV